MPELLLCYLTHHSSHFRWWAKLLSRPVFSDFRTFRVTCHTRCHIIKLTVTLLFRRSYFTVHIYFIFISFVILFFFLAFSAFCHTVARVTADVTAEVSAEAISTFADLSKISLFCYFLVLFHFIIFGFLWVCFHSLAKPSARQPRPKLALAILGQLSLWATSGSEQKKLRCNVWHNYWLE